MRRCWIATQRFGSSGIYDIIGHATYENSPSLLNVLRGVKDSSSAGALALSLTQEAPVYFLDTLWKTDFSSRVSERLQRTGLNFRVFDPQEQSRLSAPEATSQVSQSLGVVLQLVDEEIAGHQLHNLRASFTLAGLHQGDQQRTPATARTVAANSRRLPRACAHLALQSISTRR